MTTTRKMLDPINHQLSPPAMTDTIPQCHDPYAQKSRTAWKLLVLCTVGLECDALQRRVKPLVPNGFTVDEVVPTDFSEFDTLFTVQVSTKYHFRLPPSPPCFKGLNVLDGIGRGGVQVFDGRRTCLPVPVPLPPTQPIVYSALAKLFMGQVSYHASLGDVWGMLRCALPALWYRIVRVEVVTRWSTVKRRHLGFHVYCEPEFANVIIETMHNRQYCTMFMELTDDEPACGPRSRVTIQPATSTTRHRS